MQFLQNLWNSAEQLSNAFRVITVISILATASFGGLLLIIKERIGVLQAEKSAEKERLQQEKITSQEDDVKRLKDELSAVNEKAAQLEAKAIDAARNVTDSYDFNGVHRQTSGGRTSATVGNEVAIFQQLIELQEKQDWNALLVLSESQIEGTPNWLTPYLMAGVALANLSRFEEAKKRLESVVTRAGNDPQYSEARTILEQIQEKAR
jgi:hypothetical protein